MHIILNALRELFNAQISSGSGEFTKIKSVRYGKPLKIGVESLPAITISPVETIYATTGTKLSKRENVIEVTVVFNASDYYKTSPNDPFKVYAVEAGIAMAEKMGSNHGIDQNSIIGVIMSNIRLPYDDDGTTRNACDFCLVEASRYELRQDGNFPTYEIVVRINARTVGDRK